MSIDTAIERMIESYIDDQDFVSRTDASMEAESYTDQCIGEEKLSPASRRACSVLMKKVALVTRLEALEEKAARSRRRNRRAVRRLVGTEVYGRAESREPDRLGHVADQHSRRL
jgi:hypothetical protein